MDRIYDKLAEYAEPVKLTAAVIGGVATYLWGPWDAMIIALIVMVSADYITGIIKGAVRRELSSEIGWKGLLKKVMTFVVVAVASVADRLISGSGGTLRSAVILYYIANEALSILENAGEIGLPIPAQLKKAMKKINDSADDAEKEEEKTE